MTAELPLIERTTVRLVVLDIDRRVLLFHTNDPTYPELGTWWELPGGGIEPGETYTDAALRELHEETGIAARAEQVTAPTWRRGTTFRYRGERRVQHESVLLVRLDRTAPEVDGRHRVDFEDEDYFDFRWWLVDEIVHSTERFFPGRLPSLLPRFLAGEAIDEPFETWS